MWPVQRLRIDTHHALSEGGGESALPSRYRGDDCYVHARLQSCRMVGAHKHIALSTLSRTWCSAHSIALCTLWPSCNRDCLERPPGQPSVQLGLYIYYGGDYNGDYKGDYSRPLS